MDRIAITWFLHHDSLRSYVCLRVHPGVASGYFLVLFRKNLTSSSFLPIFCDLLIDFLASHFSLIEVSDAAAS